MSRATTVANVAQRLADRTQGWRTAAPSLGAILDAADLADEAARRLAHLADGEALGQPSATAAELAAEASRTARAAHSLAAGWAHALPDKEAVADAQRIAVQLLRVLAQLAPLTSKDELADDHQ